MKIYFFRYKGLERIGAYETVSEPFGAPGYEQFLARNIVTGKVDKLSIDLLLQDPVFTERSYDSFIQIAEKSIK